MISNNYISAAFGLALLAGTSSAQDLVISEIVDGPLSGGLPTFVELTNNSAATIDLSGFSIANINNGGVSLGGGTSHVLAGMLPPGRSFVIAYDFGDVLGMANMAGEDFFGVYGCDADDISLGKFINGDDVVALYLADGLGANGEALGNAVVDPAFPMDPVTVATLHDVYGVIGVNGDGEVWDYTDSYANRVGTAANGGVFDPLLPATLADWNFGGTNGLEAGCGGDDICETMNLLMLTSPDPLGGCTPPPVGFPDLCNGNGDIAGCGICPCGNTAPSGTIGGCLNRSGNATRLHASGDTSVSLPTGMGTTTDLRFNVDGLPPLAFGVLISGDAVAPTGAMNMCSPLNTGIPGIDRDGLRCAVMSTFRHGGRSANAMGEINAATGPDRVWGGEAQPFGGIFTQGGFSSGQTRFFQLTHREDSTMVCGFGLNTSQAVEVMFTP